ncbi:MAG: hypothetical protein GX491_20985 [Chloroflexi bacterium]|nr:hypothetical protein [Chloroflexota bacterium]
MKTYIVHLEPHDDIISTRDKISWSKANRVLLVWPRKGRILERRVDLLLLQRHCQHLGAQLGIVTKSGEVKNHAAGLGIPVFPNTVQAKASSWRTPRRSRRRQAASIIREVKAMRAEQRGDEQLSRAAQLRQQRDAFRARPAYSRWVQVIAFLLGVLAFLSLLFFFIPEARVELLPKRVEQSLTIEVWANPEIRAANLSGGLPAHVLKVVVEGRDQADSTGRVLVPEQAAVGQVQLTNLTDQAVIVPEGSIVLSADDPPVRFLITRSVEVPPGPETTVTAPVRAALPGAAGNVPAGQIRAMEGPVGRNLLVHNPDPTSGGSDRSRPAPSSLDYLRMRKTLLEKLQETAVEEFSSRLEPGQRLLEETVKLSAVIEEVQEPEAGQPSDRFGLTIRAEFEAWAVSESDLLAVANAALDATAEPSYSPVSGSLWYEFIGPPAFDKTGSVRWNISIGRMLEAVWSDEAALTAIRGRRAGEAKQLLQANLLLEQPPVISYTPAWWEKVAVVPFRVVLVKR